MKQADRVQLWRFGAVALFCGVPLLLAALAVDNMVEAASASGIAARQEATASQIVRQVAKRQGQRLQPEDTAALYLATASASLARAELQERTGRLGEGAGGHLEEAQFTSSPEQENDGTVAIQLSLAIGNDALRDLLYAIETGTPLLDVTDLSAKPNNAEIAQGAGPRGLLHVDMTVQGHFKKGAG